MEKLIFSLATIDRTFTIYCRLNFGIKPVGNDILHIFLWNITENNNVRSSSSQPHTLQQDDVGTMH